jgi:TRAP-type mannitol/chloroaromatic compound transport system substrate-binding protein
VINWVGQSALPAGNPPTEGLERISAAIGSASNGQLVMKANPAGAVVPATEEWKNINSGVLDFCAGGGSYMAADLRFGTAFSQLPAGMPPLPNLIFHMQEGAAIMNKWYDQKGYKIYDVGGGFHGLPEIWISTNKPLSGPNDLKGLKMRASGDGGKILEGMGVGTVFMPLGEVFEAMQRGVIDAFEVSCPAFNYSMGMHEAAKYNYMSPSRAPTEVYGFLVNKDKFNALPAHLQTIVVECAKSEAIKYNQVLHSRNAEALAKMTEYGNINLALPSSIDEAFVAGAKVFYKAEVEKFPELKDFLTAYMIFAKNWQELYGFPYAVMTSFD